MDEGLVPEALLKHLTRTTRLSEGEARRVVLDVLAYYSEEAEEFVGRRHAELKSEGLTNAVIYERIARELGGRRFPGPDLSQRQIRRLIYG